MFQYSKLPGFEFLCFEFRASIFEFACPSIGQGELVSFSNKL